MIEIIIILDQNHMKKHKVYLWKNNSFHREVKHKL
jgi:hypothetical protein